MHVILKTMLGMNISLIDATQLKTINYSVTKQQESELKLWGMISQSFFSNFTQRGEHNNSTITLVCSSSRIHCSLFCRPHLSSSGSVCTTLTGASSPRGAASTLLFIYTFSRATLASIRSRQLMNLLAFASSRGRCLSL